MSRKPNTTDVYAPEDFLIDRKMPATEQVYKLIRKRIVELELEPGEPISDAAIALAAGISRTPAREAIKRLEKEGLVEVYPSNGTFVSKINLKHVVEAIFIRQTLESEVAARCAASTKRSDLVHLLTEITNNQRYVQEQQDGQRVYGLDEAFHRALFDACDLSITWNAIMIARGHMDRIHYLTKKKKNLAHGRALNQHIGIKDAIKAGDVDASRKLMQAHVIANNEILEKAKEHSPEYFRP